MIPGSTGARARARSRAHARAFVLAAAALMLLAVPALAGVWTGSEFDDVVRGSHAGDQINGLGGDDDLLGLAGNDLYVFGEEWGHDRIEERATFKVGKKRKPGGTDFLDFSEVTSGPVDAFLVPQWGPAFNGVGGAGGGNDVALGASPVEGVIGSRAGTADQLNGGGAANLLHTGGGGGDFLFDVGGWPKGAGGRPGVPASKDVYTGVAGNDGLVQIADWGGEPDILDLRPLASADLRVQALDADGDPNRTLDSLQIDWDGGGLVWILGHYGDYRGQSAQFGQRGRLELLALSDGYFQTPVTPQPSTESSAKRQGPASADAVLERIPSRLAEAAAERLRDAASSAFDVPAKAPAGDRDRAQVPAGGADAVALLRSADLDLPADRPDRNQGGDGRTKDGEQSAEPARSGADHGRRASGAGGAHDRDPHAAGGIRHDGGTDTAGPERARSPEAAADGARAAQQRDRGQAQRRSASTAG